MKGSMTILRGLNDIRASYILESELPDNGAVLLPQVPPRAAWKRIASSGWFAAAVSVVVALGVLTAIVLAGRGGPGGITPPVGTRPTDTTAAETEMPTEGETEPAVVYTEGLEFAPIDGEEGACYVAGIGKAKDKRIRIPETSPEGLTVVFIGEKAFMGNTDITEVILPDTVESIQPYAFENCSNLKKVVLGASFKSLMPRAFYNCVKLDDINLTHDHEVWTYAMARTLWAENHQEEFMIYGGHLIGYCGNDRNVVIPNGVVYVDGAFQGNTRITSVTVPAGCERVTSGTFNSCTSLKSVTLPDSLFLIDATGFAGCTSLTSIQAPGATRIAYRAFLNCYALTNIDLTPVQYIYGEAFANCVSLTSVTFSDNLLYLAESAFHNTSMTEITIPASIIRMDATVFNKCSRLAKADVSSPMVGDGCFTACTALKEIILHDGVQTLGNDIFKDCTALERIVLPSTVTEIGHISAIPSEDLVIEYAGTAEDFAKIQMDEQTAALLLPYIHFSMNN